jgi:hypothetical protein
MAHCPSRKRRRNGPRRPRPRKKSSRRCPVTGKVRYRDHAEAVTALHRVLSIRRLHNGPVPCARRERRGYGCHFCKGWHLTSQPMRHESA